MSAYSNDDGQWGCIIIVAIIGLPIWIYNDYGVGWCVLTVLSEIILIIMAIAIFFKTKPSKTSNSLSESNSYYAGSNPNDLEVFLELNEEKVNGYNFNSFVAKIKGAISASEGKIEINFTLYEVDYKGDRLPIFSSLEDIQGEGCIFISNEYKLPYQDNIISRPIQILAPIPIPMLLFSKKGMLNLECIISVWERRSLKDGKNLYYSRDYPIKISTALGKIKYFNNENGYFDISKERDTTYEIAVKLAVLLSRCDGDADKDEAAFIKAYISKIIERTTQTKKLSLKNSLNLVIREAFDVPLNLAEFKVYIDLLCDDAKDFSIPNKMEIINLLLKLSTADGVAKKEEFSFIEYVVENLGVDYEEYKKIRDKIIDVKMYEVEEGESVIDAKRLFAITDDMSVEEIKSILNKEYRKWNSLQHSKDEAIKEQAKNMIKLIAEERKKLKNR